MRILLAVHQFLPQYTSGTEVLTLDTARRLKALGHEVRILTAEPATPAEVAARPGLVRDDYDGLHVERWHHSFDGMKNTQREEYWNPVAYRVIADYLKTWRPDVVHVTNMIRLSTAVVRAAKDANLPVVFTATDFWTLCFNSKLQRHDGSDCAGPNRIGSNCLQCYLVMSQVEPAKRLKFERLPNWWYTALALGCRVVPLGFVRRVVHGRKLARVESIIRRASRAPSWFARKARGALRRLATLQRSVFPLAQNASARRRGSEESRVSLPVIAQRPPREPWRHTADKLLGLIDVAQGAVLRPVTTGRALESCDRVFAPTSLTFKLFTGRVPAQKLTQSAYGLNTTPLHAHTIKPPRPAFTIGYVGQLGEHKGVHLLLEAFRILAAEPLPRPIACHVYGDESHFPPYMERLRHLASDEPRVRFCGTFPQADLGRTFDSFDVLVVPSIWYENAPLVIYSAFATGTPVVCTDLGGMSTIVTHNTSGLTFPKGDSPALADQLRRLVVEPGLWERLRAGIPHVKSIEENADELVRQYQTF